LSSVRIAQESARGTFILLVGNVLSTAILTVATIFIARLLGPDGYGVYTLAFVLPGLLIQFVGLGVNVAITRYIAVHLSRGEVERARSVTRTATVFLFMFGVALSAVNFVVAPAFVMAFMHRPELVSYVQLASLWVLGVALTQCVQSTFVGWVSMAEASGFSVLLAVLKLVLSVGLIVAGFGVYGAVVSHVAAYLVDGVVGVAALYALKLRGSKGEAGFYHDVRSMLGYGFPLFASQIASGLAAQYATIVLAAVASDAVVGYYATAINVTVAITVLSGALSTSLYRSFAALEGLKEDVSLAFDYSVKYSSYILTPLVFFLLVSARPLVDILFGGSYAPTAGLLAIAAASFVPVAIGYLVLSPFFNGVGKSRLTLFISVIGAVVQAVGSYVLGDALGMGAVGVMVALVLSNVAITVSGLALAMDLLGTRLSVKPLLGILLSGCAAGLAVWLLPGTGLLSIEALVLDSAVFLLLYATLVPLFSGVDENDLVRLSIAVQTMGPLRRLLEAFLGYERRILRARGGAPGG